MQSPKSIVYSKNKSLLGHLLGQYSFLLGHLYTFLMHADILNTSRQKGEATRFAFFLRTLRSHIEKTITLLSTSFQQVRQNL